MLTSSMVLFCLLPEVHAACPETVSVAMEAHLVVIDMNSGGPRSCIAQAVLQLPTAQCAAVELYA